MWKTKHLTLLGKVQILKTLVISQIQHIIPFLTLQKQHFIEIKHLFMNFINFSSLRIKYHTLILQTVDGGINFPDFQTIYTSVKTKWALRILTNNRINHVTKGISNMLCMQLGQLGNLRLDKLTIRPPIQHIDPYILENLLCLYSFRNTIQPTHNTHSFMTSFLWYNKNITHENKTLYFKNWLQSGFNTVSDLYDASGKFLKGNDVYNRLINRVNWISQYKTIKKQSYTIKIILRYHQIPNTE